MISLLKHNIYTEIYALAMEATVIIISQNIQLRGHNQCSINNVHCEKLSSKKKYMHGIQKEYFTAYSLFISYFEQLVVFLTYF
jgi:hypothetical protein